MKNLPNPKQCTVFIITDSFAAAIAEFSMLIVAVCTEIFLSAIKLYELFQLIDDFSMCSVPNRKGK